MLSWGDDWVSQESVGLFEYDDDVGIVEKPRVGKVVGGSR